MPIEDTGWRKPEISVQNDLPTGTIQPATWLQVKPCFTCRSFENDKQKLIQFLRARGLTPNAEGAYVTPIVQDFDQRESLRIDPRNFGYCRRGCYVTHMNATCANWESTRFASELAGKIK